jgi:cytochrome c peroxidase
LGRVLFYDNKLSINNKVSCASCHIQANGFADTTSTSLGFEGVKTVRNSMSIINAVNVKSYFWDERSISLEEMVLQPVRHQVEMGMEKSDMLVLKLSEIDYYKPLFEKAFGSSKINKESIAKALAQFLRSMASYNTLADSVNIESNYLNNNVPSGLTDKEFEGAKLFFGKAGCDNCHRGQNFNGKEESNTANIGLELHYTDKGIGFLDAGKEGVFKIPSLRNIQLTAPYMHDGRFSKLLDVVNHYSDSVVKHINLDPRLTETNSIGGPVRKLKLTTIEKENLVEFLNILTDKSVVTAEKFSNPFR